MSEFLMCYLKAGLFLSPVFFCSCFYEAFHTPKLIWTVLFLFTGLLFTRIRLYKSGILLFISSLTAFFWIQTILSGNAPLKYHYFLLFYPAIYLYLLNLVSCEKMKLAIENVIVSAAFLICTEGFIAAFNGFISEGLMGNRQFSGMIVICAFLILLFQQEKKIWHWTVLLFISIYPLYTMSLVSVMGLLTGVFFFIRQKLSEKNKKLILILFLAAISIAFVANVRIRGSGSKQFRVLVWKKTIEMIFDNPLGIGLGRFDQIYTLYRSQEEFLLRGESTLVENCHNEFLNLIAETGVFGIFFLLILLLTIKKLFFSSLSDENSRDTALFLFILLCSMVSFPFRVNSSAVVFLFFLACMERPVYLSVKIDEKMLRGVLLTAVFVSALISYRFILGDYYAGQACETDQLKEKTALLEKAAPLLHDFRTHFQLTDSLITENRIEEAKKACAEGLRLNPFNPYACEQMGYIMLMENNLKQALICYEQALKLNPGSEKLKTNIKKIKEKIN